MCFFLSSRRRHTRLQGDWSSDVCSSDLNRAGLERTLHRISAIRNRKGDVVGLTCRIGRAVYGTIEIIRDIIESGQSRSEEHTSELQSPCNLVCRLLLEKKKNNKDRERLL